MQTLETRRNRVFSSPGQSLPSFLWQRPESGSSFRGKYQAEKDKVQLWRRKAGLALRQDRKSTLGGGRTDLDPGLSALLPHTPTHTNHNYQLSAGNLSPVPFLGSMEGSW
jgi:hypothetical protein